MANTDDRSHDCATKEEAFSYLCEVQRRFAGDGDAYRTFLGTLNAFTKKELRVKDVASKMKVLFRGHPDLALAFNVFLPSKHWIEVVEGGTPWKPCAGSKEVFEAFWAKLKQRCIDNRTFLATVDAYCDTPARMHEEVRDLFGEEHADLAQEFESLVPIVAHVPS